MTTRTRIIPGKGVVTERVFGIPDPAVEVFGSLDVVDGQILIDGIPVSGSTGEGGYVTIIEDEGTLEGTYDSHVVCLGEATVTGEVNIRGNLLAFGDIFNSQGHYFRVRGNAKVRDLEFANENNEAPQNDIRIDGDLICRNVFFPQGGQQTASLRVYGDLIGTDDETEIWMEGFFGTNGGILSVYGDVRVGYLFMQGGSGDSGTPAGHGGELFVYGNLTVNDSVELNGGYNSEGSAGNGGYSFIFGDVQINYLSVEGGDTWDGTAGQGGYFECDGNLKSRSIDLSGGFADNLGNGGSAGTLDVQGNINCFGQLNLNGGSAWSSSGFAGNAGNLYCGGSIVVSDDSVELEGGYSNGGNAGQGGYISCTGDFIVQSDIRLEGGEGLNGSNGGSIYVGGDLICGDDLRLSGGEGTDGAGYGGYLQVDGSITVSDELELFGGDAQNGYGGNGGSIECRGNITAEYITLNGGYAAQNGNGGQGGSIDCRGDLKIFDYCDLSGGYCSATNENFYSGVGGYIECSNLICRGTMELNGGSRFGITTQSIMNNSPNGGNVYVVANALFDSIYLNGGDVSTEFPNSEGGIGGRFEAGGSVHGYELYANGGSAVGANAGRGGDILINGSITVNTLESAGGVAFDSNGVGEDAGQNGSCGGSVVLNGGSSIRDLYLIDGSGGPGSPPGNTTYLQLSGNHCINTLSLSDRSNALVFGGYTGPCTLKLSNLNGRDTFWNEGINSPTTDVTDGFGVVSIYFYSYAQGTWHRNTQTPLV